MDFATELFPHQKDAVEKLKKTRIGALYMEQGTGKTRTALELFGRRYDKGKVDLCLWLCPCSVMYNLKADIRRHCISPFPVIIRGIESLSSSDRLFVELMAVVSKKKAYLIVDESTLVKNKDAIRTKRVTALSEKCRYKLILNGTPVSRSEADLFAQWYILDWRVLGYKSFYSFANHHLEFFKKEGADGHQRTDYSRVKNVKNVSVLTSKIAPFTYQVQKKDCLHLPPKHYHQEVVRMTDEQAEEYWRVKEIYLLNVDEVKSSTIYLLFTALQHVVSGRKVLTDPQTTMKTAPLFSDYMKNPRIRVLEGIIDKLGDEKCIIFAKYQAEIDTVIELLKKKGKKNEGRRALL